MRLLLRLPGYGLVVLGFVVAVLDGTRSIANATLLTTSVGDALQAVLHERYGAIAPAIARDLHPWLADPAFAVLMRASLAMAALLIGFGLLWLGRKPAPTIGIVTRR